MNVVGDRQSLLSHPALPWLLAGNGGSLRLRRILDRGHAKDREDIPGAATKGLEMDRIRSSVKTSWATDGVPLEAMVTPPGRLG